MSSRSHLEFLSGPVQFVKGVGPRRAEALAEAGVACVRDLLQYFPRRYLDRTSVTAIRDIRPGNEPITVVGTIRATGVVPGRRGKRFEIVVMDDRGHTLKCVWFRGVSWISKAFEKGQVAAFHGKPQRYGGGLSLAHPDFDVLDEEGPALETGRIIALYPGSAALVGVGLSSRSFRRIQFGLFKEHGERLVDVFPEWIRSRYSLIDGRVALRAVHFPKDKRELEKARFRLKFEELFFIQLMLARLKKDFTREEGFPFKRRTRGARSDGGVQKSTGESSLVDRFLNGVLTFRLTGSQEAAIEDVVADTASGTRMNRLLQGDVGSGKTVVAVAALLHAVDNGFQGAFMAPTEILAEQHYRNLTSYLEPLGVGVRLLTGGMKKSERTAILDALNDGSLPIVVGTHAVIQNDVAFSRLGLCVVDEQHRFGVLQRARLFGKGDRPHVLLMTATPIPRSLALTLYGDLDVTLMKDMPPGRQAINTRLKFEKDRDKAYRTLRMHVEGGRQAYVVYPLVEESEKLDLKDAESGFEKLRGLFPGVSIELVHGRMSAGEKDAAMRRFVSGEARILVSTTVIEVGVDVANATLMIIEHAERFGLSQLHQLRGRVGRGSHESECILMAEYRRTQDADERLRTMTRTNDGFEISEVDLRLRGAGDFFGTRQSGLPDLKIADIVTDTEILLKAREAAFELVDEDSGLDHPEHGDLVEYFDAFYGSERLGLSRVG